MIETVGCAARRQGVSGLHVHVGVESADRCYERLESVLPWLPVVLALSVNSPFVDGATTGMLSNRVAHPRRAARRRRAARVRGLRGLGGLGRASRRARRDRGSHARLVGHPPAPAARHARDPHRRPADRARAHGAHRRDVAARRSSRSAAPRRDDRGATTLQNRWAAAHLGLDAELIHPDGDRARARRASSRASCSAPSRPSRRRSRSSPRLGRRRGPRGADGSLTTWQPDRRRSRSAASAASAASTGSPARSPATRASSARTRT